MTAVFHGGPQPIEMTWKSALTERHIPTKAELQTYMREHRNWERWGDKSEAGMVNLITAEKRVASARLVTSRRTKSETSGSGLHDRHGHGDVSGDDRIRERPMSPDPGRWLAAIEKLAVARNLVSLEELGQRTCEYVSGEREE